MHTAQTYYYNNFFLSIFLPAEGYCFNGECPTLDRQCEGLWGYGGIAADHACYEQFNTKGSINGHCGTDENRSYKQCPVE